MELLAIFIGIVILIGMVLFISRPLLQANRLTKSSGADAALLEARRESLYTQIKELDMDHATGKVNDEDYAAQRSLLVAQAADVLKQIDALATATPLSPEDEAEALIAARRKPRSDAAATAAVVATATDAAATTKSTDAKMEAAIAARRKTPTPAASPAKASAPVCPKCGKSINADDAFCAKCGAALQPQAVR